jgi:Xaa-Pro dipeptidase
MPWSKGARLRTKRLTDFMERHSLDIALITSRKHVYYFTDFESPRLVLPTCLLVFRNDEPVLITGRTEEELAERAFGGEVRYYANYDIRKRIVAYPDLISTMVAKIVASPGRKVKTVGVEGWDAPEIITSKIASSLRRFNLYDLSRQLMKFRRTKDPDEIEKIEKSCRLNDFAYSVAKPLCTPGRSEVEVYAAVHGALQNRVGTFQYFAGDFASGERAAKGGGAPTSKVLRKGETFYLDLWVVKDGYWSDTSRTFIVGGEPSRKQAEMHRAVEEALLAGEALLRPGVSAREVFSGVFKAFRNKGYADFFNQHAGHGVGLEGQEPPFFIPASNERLEEGVVCALEPGLFGPGFGGIQIEDNYVIRKDGPVRLTDFPHDLA